MGLWCGSARAQAPSTAPTSAAQGEALFSGAVPLANRGPACIACHSAAGLRFPNGGTLGPDLTHVYSRMGPRGVLAALTTLYFPAMTPLYLRHPLAPPERRDLTAFLQQADTASPPRHATAFIAGMAGMLFLLLLGITARLGRTRLRGVRRRLLANARLAPRRSPPAPATKGETP